jgi:hypothetical protein
MARYPTATAFHNTRNATLLFSVSLGVVTSTVPVVAPVGTVAVISVAEATLNSVGVPLNVTELAPVKSLPRIVITVSGCAPKLQPLDERRQTERDFIHSTTGQVGSIVARDEPIKMPRIRPAGIAPSLKGTPLAQNLWIMVRTACGVSWETMPTHAADLGTIDRKSFRHWLGQAQREARRHLRMAPSDK